ncbi:glycerophosphodiester phosphodiesterase family protein [Enterococcus sp. AZ177]|uniref:glycerophosphodiester phosphodiesterase family protein n=1 Tax=unclassified Enterococcus TaxID=2608891 RepID=UPI003D2FEC5E
MKFKVPKQCNLDTCNCNWLIPVASLDKIGYPDYNHAYILPDDTIWTLSANGENFIQLNESTNGPNKPTEIKNIDGNLTIENNGTFEVIIDVDIENIKKQIGLDNLKNDLDKKQDKLTAGDNITITSEGVISAESSVESEGVYQTGGQQWIAHRGNNTEYPENSLPAFKHCKRHWGIETDIQVTSDGYWVIMHDDTVDRTTNGTGAVKSMTFDQFRSLRIDTGANIGSLTDAEKIPPTFEEYLRICKAQSKVPVIEIKSGNYSNENYTKLYNTIRQFGYNEGDFVIASFSYDVLTKIREFYSNNELHLFTSSVNEKYIQQCKDLKKWNYSLVAASVKYNDINFTSEVIDEFRKSGIKIGTWTVPDIAFDTVSDRSVDYITTNSLSGNLKYQALNLQNGFTNNNDNGRIKESFVEELDGGLVHVSFNVSGGDTTQNKAIALLPDWAIPMYRQYSVCSVRTSDGADIGTFDVNGRLVPGSATAGSIAVGLNWAKKTTWAAGDATYKI